MNNHLMEVALPKFIEQKLFINLKEKIILEL